MKYLIFSVLLISSAASVSVAQSTTLHQRVYWLRYHSQLIFTERLSWINEIDNRRFFSPGIQNQLIAHTHLHYFIKNLEPAIGCSFSWQYAQEPDVGYDVAVPEIRPFQELTYHIRISKTLKFNTRFRFDERFIRKHTATELTNGYDYTGRMRCRAQFAYDVKSKCILKVSDEIFLNDRNNTFDQNRISASVEFFLRKKYSAEIGYIHIYQQRSNNRGFFARDVARFTVYHRLFAKGV